MDDSFAEWSSRPERVDNLEIQRPRGFAAYEVRVRRPIEIPDPDSEHVGTDDPDRPCVAQAERSAGLPWNRGDTRHLRASEISRRPRVLPEHLENGIARLTTEELHTISSRGCRRRGEDQGAQFTAVREHRV